MKAIAFIAANIISLLVGLELGHSGLSIWHIPTVVIPDQPPPVPGEGLHVLVMYETDDKISLPRGQRSIIDSVPLRQWLKEQGWESRFLDPDQPTDHLDAWFSAALSVPREGLPWVVISNGTTGTSAKLPEDVDPLKELLGRYKR